MTDAAIDIAQARSNTAAPAIRNSDIRAAVGALQAIGKTALPIPLAMRMAKLRRNLEDHEKIVEETRQAIFERTAKGKAELKSGDPELKEYSDEYAELLDQEYTLGDRFTLYVQENGGDPEYSWAPPKPNGKFKTKITELEPNVLYGLLPLVDIVDVDDLEDDDA